MKKLLVLTTLFYLHCFLAKGQSIVPKASFHVNVGLPINLKNEPFKGIMQGLVNTSAHFQYTLKNSLSFGLGVNYTYFSLNEFKIAEKINGGVQMVSGFAKIGQEKFHSAVFGTDYGLKVGYTANVFNSDSIASKFGRSQVINSFYVEPQGAIMLQIDEATTIRLVVGYVVQTFGFKPQNMGLDTDSGYNPENFNKITQYLTIGFGYTHYF